jgi:hypothetical protein
MDENIFSPRISAASAKRIIMKLSDEDHRLIRRGNWQAEVTDQNTGKRYRVRGAACNLPHCMCDAVIIRKL